MDHMQSGSLSWRLPHTCRWHLEEKCGCKGKISADRVCCCRTIGLQWNMLHGLIPDSWRNLRADTVWVRPGNYQLCGSKPLNAIFELCKEVDGKCELLCGPQCT